MRLRRVSRCSRGCMQYRAGIAAPSFEATDRGVNRSGSAASSRAREPGEARGACMIRAEMRITNVETIVLRLPEIELRADGTQDAFIVRIDTDEGVSGYGEADTSPSVASGVHRHAGIALDARRHARDAARPRSVRHRADLARPLRDDRARRHARRRDPHDLGDRHRAARPRRPRSRPARPSPARRALPRPGARVCERADARDARRGAAARHDAGRARAPRAQARLGPARLRRAARRRARGRRRARRRARMST